MKSIPRIVFVLSLGVLATSMASAAEPIQPVRPVQDVNLAQVELGKKLYFDPRLSRSGFISCNSCHNLSVGGTDNLKTSIGHNWQQGPINAPTVLNSSLNVAQFWDGRARDLKEQAGGPIENPKEMAFSHTLTIDVLQSIPEYAIEFKQVFGVDEITIDEVTQAIAEFETALRLDPGLFEAFSYYARVRFQRSELEDALELFEQAARVRPDADLRQLRPRRGVRTLRFAHDRAREGWPPALPSLRQRETAR